MVANVLKVVRPPMLVMAGWLGTALNVLGRSIPGVVGPLMVVYGLYLVWPPLAWIAAGSLVWLFDRRV